jgi:hypothetical protein
LHIEAYHSKINNRKEEKTARQNLKRNLQKLQGKSKKINYFIKRKRNANISSTRQTHAKFESLKDKSNQN